MHKSLVWYQWFCLAIADNHTLPDFQMLKVLETSATLVACASKIFQLTFIIRLVIGYAIVKRLGIYYIYKIKIWLFHEIIHVTF